MDQPRPADDDPSIAKTAGDLDPSFLSLLRQVVGDRQPLPCGSGTDAGPWADSKPVERIGRFEVIEILGRGAYGTVLRVRDLKLGCERAMKLPNPETLASPRALARFLDEARKAVRIDHPNVVRVVEADEVFSLHYMVMEFCPEGSLSGWLARRPVDRPVPPIWAAALAAEIADGVQQAHAAGLLHRDLKPGNVMLVQVGDRDDRDPPSLRPKVGDFGLAKAMGDTPGPLERTASGAMIGTLAYMSPEQARGAGSTCEASDIYGIGAILFEILTRSVPYPGSSEAEILARILDDAPPPSPRSLRPDLPRDLETICRTAMAKKPGDRYATASALADDLRRFLRNDSVKGSPWWKRARAGLRRHRSRVALVGLAATLVAALTAGLSYKDRKDASVWLERLEAADIAKLPELIAERDPPGPGLSGPLSRLFVEGTPLKKLKAALGLASSRGDCAEYAYGRLLEAGPEDVAPIARVLHGRMPRLVSNLEEVLKGLRPSDRRASPDVREADDRRRANAAASLVVLGEHDAGLRLLRFDPDPQARSMLIHCLGPAGVAPNVLHDRLIDRGTETSIRRALIQALGEIPGPAWDPAERERVLATVLGLFRDDPDSGIHGSAKWLLREWDRHADLARIEEELRLAKPREGFRWRVSQFGLTFVTVDDPEAGRVIEVSDTEVPCDLFLRVIPGHRYRKESSPEPKCPITEINYLIAARFCNELTDRDGLGGANRCYGAVSRWDVEPVAGSLDRSGYRIPTDAEFRLVCRGGTVTRRSHGDSTDLLPRYAWYDQRTTMRTQPVGQLKPNEFGLFDTLGNAREVCHASRSSDHSRNRAMMCGGSVKYPEFDLACDGHWELTAVSQQNAIQDAGFRVARTIVRRTGAREDRIR